MSKKEIGAYYVSLSRGDHSLFLSLVCIIVGGSYDRWLRLFRAWRRNAIAVNDATEEEFQKLNGLIFRESWRETCNNMRRH